MSNFFKRNQADDYENFQTGVLSEELRQSISAEDRIISPKGFLISFSRFLAIFIIVFSIALTSYWLWRENSSNTVETSAPEIVASQQVEAVASSSTATTGVIASDAQSTASTVSAAESSIVTTGSNLVEITLWVSVAALILFACLATASHRLLHNLLNF